MFGELPGEHTLSFEYVIETYQDGRYIGGGASGSQIIIYVSQWNRESEMNEISSTNVRGFHNM